MEYSYLRESLSFLQSLSLRKQGAGIQRYAARLKLGSFPVPDQVRDDPGSREDDIHIRILILLKIYVELKLFIGGDNFAFSPTHPSWFF